MCSMGWPEQWDGCPPSPCHRLIQDLRERRTRVSTVPIKNKLCNRWIPISCSLGMAQSYPSLAVAQGRLSHSWKSGLTDISQQDRPMCLRGERFCYRPALGSVQTENGWQRSLVYFSLFPSMKDHFGVLFLTWGQTAEHFLCCCHEPSRSPGMHPHPGA